MASKELIIDDEFCNKMGAYLINQGDLLDQVTASYVSILQDVRENGIVGGETAESLSKFIDYATEFKEKMKPISNRTKSKITAFLSNVDAADSYLF